MSTYNQKGKARTQARSPVKTMDVPTGRTYEGHPGYERDLKSELFTLAVTQLMGQDSFYESGQERDRRLVELVHYTTILDPVWVLQLARWLRNEAHLRSVALVVGLEGAKALLATGAPSVPGYEVPGINTDQGLVRLLAKAGIARADEPGEALAYWHSRYGRRVPIPVKKAIADMAVKLYTEFTLLKHDTDSHAFRFGDVIELTHPNPIRFSHLNQSDLFRYAIDRRHNRVTDSVAGLEMISQNMALWTEALNSPEVMLDPRNLRKAGMTWEDALSLAGSKLDKAQLWGAMIPNMGYMALLRNLRNFDQAGMSNELAGVVAAKLSNPEEVARSRQLPLRFMSAYEQTRDSLRWSWALEQALNHSLANVPTLPGRTLILVDTSGSMDNRFSDRGTLKRWDMAVLFGLALAMKSNADVVSFSHTSKVFPFRGTASLLASVEGWKRDGFMIGRGTYTAQAVNNHFRSHDRVVIITDEQAHASRRGYLGLTDGLDTEITQAVPANVPMHIINVAGYRFGSVPSGSSNRHVYSGLTDQVFTLIPLVEAGVNGQWPWEGA